MKSIFNIFIKTRFGKYFLGDWLSAYQSMPESTGMNSYRRWLNRKHMSNNFSSRVNHTEIMFLRWALLLVAFYSISETIINGLKITSLIQFIIFAPPLIIILLGTVIKQAADINLPGGPAGAGAFRSAYFGINGDYWRLGNLPDPCAHVR